VKRLKRIWTVKLQAQTGEIVDRTVSAFWSNEYEFVKEAIGMAAAVGAWMDSGKEIEFIPVLVEEVGPEALVPA
jgi:hypothetical protein